MTRGSRDTFRVTCPKWTPKSAVRAARPVASRRYLGGPPVAAWRAGTAMSRRALAGFVASIAGSLPWSSTIARSLAARITNDTPTVGNSAINSKKSP